MLYKLQLWSHTRGSWQILFLSAAMLIGAALAFQHLLGHAPCVMCIYQRTAVFGILLAAFLPMLHNTFLVRIVAYAIWGTSAVKGFVLSSEHKDILFSENSFLVPCPVEPEFPSVLPLHEWLPDIFAAPGSCLENTWQFIGMGMAEWMQIIFAMYIAAFVVFFVAQFVSNKR
ncbi:disulfide bond formation protein DsbB [Glaciecola sp. MH2013]|uniref:disulfide bond formation protein DsbB n=1 Tax=Glaciecola sp. MH2013 TaxID=2785524 RepID=UPI00189F5DAE|nr:disulfide bond formation protein DsbB [Glaciecola sp. MH2013]MBF7072510.1 disulfide bond formation protein DsbB [Glaciecola sp. MH2013]